MNSEQSFISFKNVWFGYNHRSKDIIKELSIDIYDQSITTILGLNGSGKTTLLLLLLGIFPPNKGELIFWGKEKCSRIREKVNIGYVPQYEEIPFGYSVFEYVLLGRFPFVSLFGSPSDRDRKVVTQILCELRISELRDLKLLKISGGELQKVRIARVLAQQPEILLLDEPTTHLDLKSKRSIQEIIINQKKQGKTIIFTTHEPSEAIYIADYVLLMKKGEKAKYAIKDKLLTNENLSYFLEIPLEIIDTDNRKVIINKRN